MFCFSQGVLIFKFSDWSGASYGNYEFPLFADLLGWAVGLSTIMLFPVGVGWAWYHGYVRILLVTVYCWDHIEGAVVAQWKNECSPIEGSTIRILVAECPYIYECLVTWPLANVDRNLCIVMKATCLRMLIIFRKTEKIYC